MTNGSPLGERPSIGRRTHHESACIELAARGLLACAGSAFAQQGTTEIRGRVIDTSNAAVPGATVDRQEPEHRHVPRDHQRRGRYVFRRRHRARDLRSDRGAAGLQEARDEGYPSRDRQDDHARLAARPRRARRDGPGHRRFTARRRDDERSRRQYHGSELIDLPSINRNFIGFIGLLPGHPPEHQHRVVRLGLDFGERLRSAQQQLHARRRQQQR